MTTREAVKRYKVSRQTLYYWRSRGFIDWRWNAVGEIVLHDADVKACVKAMRKRKRR